MTYKLKLTEYGKENLKGGDTWVYLLYGRHVAKWHVKGDYVYSETPLEQYESIINESPSTRNTTKIPR